MWTFSNEMFSMMSSAFAPLITMHECSSPGRKSDGNGRSSCWNPWATTLARMWLKVMLRTMPVVGAVDVDGDVADACVACVLEDLRRRESKPIEIGPVTL